MYTYWTAVQKEEHMLYAKEVADSLGICSLSTINKVKVASTAMTKILNETTTQMGIPEYYYNHKNGLSRVYPSEVISRTTMRLMNESTKIGSLYMITIDGKNYKYALRDELRDAFIQLSPESYDEEGNYISDPTELALRKIQLGKRLSRYDKAHLERASE